MGSNTPRGHTGQTVREPGTYRASDSRETWTYLPGDMFRKDPKSGEPTVWVKTFEPDHPSGTR
ncbi:MAG TPA: hypothetical protein VNT75_31380 [Symbiobacteriaceae bacterium]|nr:hypothetical protein [Symbiobacteriaceae bacterium]